MKGAVMKECKVDVIVYCKVPGVNDTKNYRIGKKTCKVAKPSQYFSDVVSPILQGLGLYHLNSLGDPILQCL